MTTLAFIGAGRMASAMVDGILAAGRIKPSQIIACAGPDLTAEALRDRTGIQVAPTASSAAATADFVILACKPQQLESLDPGLAEACSGKAILSILAGIPIKRLRTAFPKARLLIRAMPNTPGQIRAGITGYATQPEPEPADADWVAHLLGALGEIVPVAESDLDAVTAVSGSGPGYVFEFCAALREAGIAQGLTPDVADRLARATLLGSARLLDHAPSVSAEEQRDRVTSPGGTTEAGLKILSDKGFRQLLRTTVEAAADRSRELGR